MRVTAVEAVPLAVATPDTASADQAQETVVLLVETDEGLVGVAEVNHTPAAVVAFARARATSNQTRGVRDILVGRDPLDVADLRRELLIGNQSSSRRGCGLAVLNAIDVALWDIRAQAAGVPLWQLLWGAGATSPDTYLTLYTGASGYPEAVDRLHGLLDRAGAVDCARYKVEPLVECCPEDRVLDFVASARAAIGAGAELFVDVYQRFTSAQAAARYAADLGGLDVGLLETPLPIDDLDGYARLAELTELPIAAAELYESPWEFVALLDFGAIDIAQPWPNRVGVSGTLEVVEHARQLGRRVVLGGWNATPIGNLLGIHLAAGLGPGIALEYAPALLYPDGFALRHIASPEPAPVAGRFPLPTAPGLGVELDDELLAHYRAAAAA
jgi:L-alanine-DL-glutamate epimerase-like enolase superfamily enzyme